MTDEPAQSSLELARETGAVDHFKAVERVHEQVEGAKESSSIEIGDARGWEIKTINGYGRTRFEIRFVGSD